ncbi:MAG: hypothetical protein WC415_05110 [Patescibacteria group bacterium]|jgi:hypothetical protein
MNWKNLFEGPGRLLGGFAFSEAMEGLFPRWFDRKRDVGGEEKKDSNTTERAGVGGLGIKDEIFTELAENLAKHDPAGPKTTVEELKIIFSAVASLGKPSYKRTMLELIGHQATSVSGGVLNNPEGARILSNLTDEIRNACGKKFNKKTKPTKRELKKAWEAVITHLLDRGILRDKNEEVKEVVDTLEKAANAIVAKLGYDGPDTDRKLKKKEKETKKWYISLKKKNQVRRSNGTKLWQIATVAMVALLAICIFF